mgnify:CR=1 FL=1
MLEHNTAYYEGNSSHLIDWDTVIQSLKNNTGKEIAATKNKKELVDNPEYSRLFELWESRGFNLSSAKWTNFYPGDDYSDTTIPLLEDYLKVHHIRSWISRIDPGYCTPWHWDIDNNINDYKKLGDLVRYSIHISKPDYGHAFLIGKTANYFCEQGDVYRWSDYDAWHGGFNCGVSPKYLLNFLSYI